MGPPEMLNLRWDGFEANARVAFREFREDREFLDVTLVAGEGNHVQANKVILAGGSSFFHKIFRENPHPHPMIYLKGVNSKHVLSILDFLYTGEASIVHEDLTNFLDIAKDLKVKGLTEKYQVSQSPKISHIHSVKSAPQGLAEEEAFQSPKISHLHGLKSSPQGHLAAEEVSQSPTISHLHSMKSAPRGHLADEEAGQSPTLSHLHVVKSAPQGHLAAEEAGQSPKISHVHSVKPSPQQDRVAAEEAGQSPKISHVHSVKPAPPQDGVAAEEAGQSPKISHVYSVKPAPPQDGMAAEEAGQSPKISHLHSVSCSNLNNIFVESTCEEDHDNSSETYDVKVEEDDQLSNASYGMTGLGMAHNRHDSMRDLYYNEETFDSKADIFCQNEDMVLNDEYDQNDKDISAVVNVLKNEQSTPMWYEQGEENEDANMVLDEQDLMQEEFSSGKQYFQASGKKDFQSSRKKDFQSSVQQDFKCSGKQYFQCSVCNKTFSTARNLERHELIHSGEKPFRCLVCAKMFSRLDHLKLHEKIHTGEKPYQCLLCFKRFIQLSNLKSHMKCKKDCSMTP